uniref:sensor histidine kinase n=1 Tax=Alistipes sp. TaxID=1872444 RepID=UPI004056118C
MKTARKQYIGENLIYFLVWSAIILVPIMAAKMLGHEHVQLENVLISWRKISPYLILFLVHNSLLAPKLLLKHRYIAYVAANLALVTLIFGVVDAYEQFLLRDVPDVETMIENRKASFTDLALPWNILLGIFMTSVNSMIKLLYEGMRREVTMEELKRHNLQAEIDYLKYQVNPHFFMNTLNNIHALIDIDTEEAKSSLIELSKMMRYVLYESGEESISLRQDLQFIENYVRLMQIRYTEELEIRIEYPHDKVARITIPPLLLIVFVENAFKHGVGTGRGYIHIKIEIIGEKIRCTVANSKRPKKEGEHPGIGLSNVSKRLQLIYGENYTLSIRDLSDEYIVQLTIPQIHD